jgi:2-oxoglutarate dehydrogenase E1 component
VRVGKLAFAFRQAFEKDVVIDMVCYRRFGHNEGDEPSYTQPQMYERIEQKRSVRKLYTEALVKRGDLTMEEAEQALNDFSARLQAALEETRESSRPMPTSLPAPPAVVVEPSPLTGVPRDVLDKVAKAVHEFPPNFTVHPKLQKQLEARGKVYAEGQVDWALGEQLAFGTLLAEGTDVRLSGQDTRRGTFSHRHSVLVDYHTGVEYVPLWELGAGQGRFFIYDSLLSEYAALGFEYGYSVVQKNALVGWEAQFGDFANGAQIIIDQFLVAAEDKWGQTSGLVLLLPHGYEGQGPEHSSARLERFLSSCAEGNITVASPTTAAQYFHILRRQVRRDKLTPLVVMTPKWLLRRKEAYSPVEQFVDGRFLEVMDDATIADPDSVCRVVFASGKVAVQVETERDSRNAPVAIVRVEQLYPWPEEQIAAILDKYAHAQDVVWLQEEPRNMGAWTYLRGKLARIVGDQLPIVEVTRVESGSPASGSAGAHVIEQADLFNRALTL